MTKKGEHISNKKQIIYAPVIVNKFFPENIVSPLKYINYFKHGLGT